MDKHTLACTAAAAVSPHFRSYVGAKQGRATGLSFGAPSELYVRARRVRAQPRSACHQGRPLFICMPSSSSSVAVGGCGNGGGCGVVRSAKRKTG